MPYMKNGKRDYKREYDLYQSRPEVKKRRARNNTARRKMERAGAVSKGDGKHVAHKDNNTRNQSRRNLSVQSASKNSSVPRTKNGRRKK